MHGFAAGVALMAFLLYADRSGWLYVHGSQSRWALVTRAGIGGVLASIAIGFMDLTSTSGASFEWRHWLILSALALAIAGHLGLRRGGPSNPT